VSGSGISGPYYVLNHCKKFSDVCIDIYSEMIALTAIPMSD